MAAMFGYLDLICVCLRWSQGWPLGGWRPRWHSGTILDKLVAESLSQWNGLAESHSKSVD
jgi:hypothetical protein